MSDFLPDVFGDSFDEGDVDGDPFAPGDGAAFATLYPTGGSPVYLPIDDEANPPTVLDAVNEAGLTVGGSTQYWVDGQQINPMETRIAPNMTITAVGNVKGG
jgi:hypothetical protein